MANKKWEEREPRPREYWRDIPGWDGKYQASTEGRVRKMLPDGSKKMVTVYTRSGNRPKNTVVLRDGMGGTCEKALLRIVAETWYPDLMTPDMQVIPRNGLHADCSAYNVRIVTPAERCRIQAAGKTRRAVMHMGPYGQLLGLYPSMAAAARETGLSVSAVRLHCIGKSRCRADDGTTYRFADKAEQRKRRGRG